MIICICGHFDIYDNKGVKTGRKEFVVSHGIDDNGKLVILPQEHPESLGAKYDADIGEYVIKED